MGVTAAAVHQVTDQSDNAFVTQEFTIPAKVRVSAARLVARARGKVAVVRSSGRQDGFPLRTADRWGKVMGCRPT